MRRRLLIAAIFLLAGAVVNVAVAWGCAAFDEMGKSNVRVGTDDEQLLVLAGFANASNVVVVDWSKVTHDGVHVVADVSGPLGHGRIELRTARVGLPLRCLEGRFNVGGRPPPVYVNAWAVPKLVKARGIGFLPCHLIWPGFAVNTTFYAIFLWLLTCLAIAVRRFLRLRRDLCPKCAYPMGESAVCTECGQELPGSVRAAT